MWFLDRLADIFTSVEQRFTSAYEAVKNVPLLSSVLGSFLYWVAGLFSQASYYTHQLSSWAEDVALQLRNIVSFDSILDWLYLHFPWLRDLFSEVRKHIELFLDTYLPWWRDVYSEIRKHIERFLNDFLPWWRDVYSEIRKHIERFLDTYLPWWRDLFSEIRRHIERFLDTYLPWWRDPEFTFWEYARSRLEDWFLDFLDLQADKIVDRIGRILERLW
jgi:hypothetical protein